MAHVYRFYCPALEAEASDLTLSGDEAHHALHVVRVKPGDTVEAFDGAGRSWSCTVRDCGRKDVVCEVESESYAERPTPNVFVTLAWLGKDKGVESLVQRCTELGVAGFRFFRGAHSVRDVKPSPKWERWAVEACKQSGRVYVPSFEVCKTLTNSIRDAEITIVGALDEDCVRLRDTLSPGPDVNVVIGPEGDFSPEEYAALRDANANFTSLGDGTYRSEVAAAHLTALVMYELGRLG